MTSDSKTLSHTCTHLHMCTYTCAHANGVYKERDSRAAIGRYREKQENSRTGKLVHTHVHIHIHTHTRACTRKRAAEINAVMPMIDDEQ